jgi:hypothetical protein
VFGYLYTRHTKSQSKARKGGTPKQGEAQDTRHDEKRESEFGGAKPRPFFVFLSKCEKRKGLFNPMTDNEQWSHR